MERKKGRVSMLVWMPVAKYRKSIPHRHDAVEDGGGSLVGRGADVARVTSHCFLSTSKSLEWIVVSV
jgi:hypothetical protein